MKHQKNKWKFNWSIRTRLFVQVGSIVCLFVVIIAVVNALFLEDFYIYREQKMLRKQAEIINQLNAEDFHDFALEMESIEKTRNVLIVIYDSKKLKYFTNMDSSMKDGIVLFGPDYIQNNSILEHKMLDDNSVYEVQQDKRMSVQYLVYRTALDSGDILDIRVIKNAVSKNVALANTFMLYVAGLTLVGALVWAFIYSKRFTRPILEMNEIARSMAELNFTLKCMADGTDEIGQLGESINHLSVSLDMALRDLTEKNKRLKNEIQRERNMDRMRKEFVANVSHELKTPIAIIMGYAEGLRLNVNEDEEKRNYYCEVIGEETAKMNKLVHGLLQLSQMESGQMELSMQEFSVSEFLQGVINKYESIFEENLINATLKFDEEKIICADPIRIEQVVTNYLNNAIAHVDEKKEIIIKGAMVDNKYRISVFNSGKNIPIEEMKNLWISFYREDKARSREQGRYGLGLSIVRAIIEMHKGRYGVRNLDGGVEFWFELQVK